jgi:uncharacterized phage-associated protein
MKICKLLYFADKAHLLEYGRPIIGDTYYKLKDGPIPTKGLDMLRGRIGPANQALVHEAFQVQGLHVIPRREPDMSVFSRSDVKILALIKDQLGEMSAFQLRKLSHDEHAYEASEMHSPIDFELIANDAPDADALREFLGSEQHTRDALLRYRVITA